MKIEFVGGAKSVTGSCYLIKDDDLRIMVDCGMFQGKRELRDRNSMTLRKNPEDIDLLLLTHAHIDHSGLIPKIVKNGFKGSIYCTKATADLCSIMLPDSAHIQEMDSKWINKKNKKLGRAEVEPLYSIEDAEKAIDCFKPVEYGEVVQIHPRVKVRFRDAGHILGSSIIEVWIYTEKKELKIVFSGDLGPKDQAIIRNPEIIDEADILFIESTYGNRLHKSREDTYTEFKEIILNSFNQKGNIIIPAFAIERTQEIIYTLARLIQNKEIPAIPVYIDSPLAISATEIFRKNRSCFDDKTWKILESGKSPLDFKSLQFTRKTEESKWLNEKARGSIIISASGMCTAGRIKHHLQHNLYKMNSSVIFVGYQAEGTLGRRLIEGAKQVKLYGKDVAVKATIHTLGGFSAHADMNGILDWISNIKNPNLKVFVVHGEEESSIGLSEKISSEFGYEAIVPEWRQIIDLHSFQSEIPSYGEIDSYSPVDKEIEDLQATMNALIVQYKHAKESRRSLEITTLAEDISDLKEMMSMITDEI